MSLDGALSKLIRDIYAAPEDGIAWDSIGQEILRQTGACAGLRTTVDLSDGEFGDIRFFGPETSGIAEAFAEYPAMKFKDPSLLWAIRNPSAGFCASDVTLPAEDYLQNECVKWNNARFGATHWYVCYSPPGASLSHSLSMHIPASQGRATREQIAKFRILFDHMNTAAWLNRQPRETDRGGAWILLDRKGQLSSVSVEAEALLSSGDGLRVSNGRLITYDPSAQAALDRCLEQVFNSIETGAGPAAVWIDRPHGRRAWLLTVRPLTVRFAGLAKVTSGCHLHLIEPRPSLGPASGLTNLFNLSPREAEVLDLLARGHSLESLARTLSISINTAKVHLQAIFGKTRTSRQSELLQLCAQVSAG